MAINGNHRQSAIQSTARAHRGLTMKRRGGRGAAVGMGVGVVSGTLWMPRGAPAGGGALITALGEPITALRLGASVGGGDEGQRRCARHGAHLPHPDLLITALEELITALLLLLHLNGGCGPRGQLEHAVHVIGRGRRSSSTIWGRGVVLGVCVVLGGCAVLGMW